METLNRKKPRIKVMALTYGVSETEQPEKPKPSHQDKLKSEFGKYSE
jgi:hypothetical protein